MRSYWVVLNLSFLLLGACDGSGDSPDGGTDCEGSQQCFVADEAFCCGGTTVEVGACESCPAGTIPERACVTVGCEWDCEDRRICSRSAGEGCCLPGRSTAFCGSCPDGWRESSSCEEAFPGCGCPEGSDAERAEAQKLSMDAVSVPLACHEALGDGCCGAVVAREAACGCPVGTIREDECAEMAPDPLGSVEECFVDEGGGCCGASVPRNACADACPMGSVSASSCAAYLEGSAAVGDAPMATCYEDLGEGCCGGAVMTDACGACPEGAIQACADFAPACGE